MTVTDYALAVACAVMIWLALALLFSCTVAAVSVDCPVATDATGATGEAGAQP